MLIVFVDRVFFQDFHQLPEPGEGSEVLKIAVRDDKCRGSATILAAAPILAGTEVIQGDQLRRSGARGPAMPHSNPDQSSSPTIYHKLFGYFLGSVKV